MPGYEQFASKNTESDGGKAKLPTLDYVLKIRAGGQSTGEAVKKILQKTDSSAIPINAWKIARQLGFKIYEAGFNDDSISGLMYDCAEIPSFLPKPEKLTLSKRAIIIDKKLSLKEKSFTIGHELGHFFLHVSSNNDYYQASHILQRKNEDDLTPEEVEYKYREDAADKFAAELLMPSEIFRGAVASLKVNSNNTKKGKELLEDLSDLFLVPEEAVRRRFEELSIAP